VGQIAQQLARTRGLVREELPDAANQPRREALELRLLHEEARLLSLRELARAAVAAQIAGQSLGLAPSVLKLESSQMVQRLSEIALDTTGRRLASRFLALDETGPNAANQGVESVHNYLYLRSRTIVAGTSEVQKNLIARSLFGS
jgi:alkylation response protein AidB-like acyl-CoA dehydrogenase